MPDPLSAADVQHVARLARLRLAPDQIDAYRAELSTVLDHLAALSELDVANVEPLAHPRDVTNCLADDVPEPGFPPEALLDNAPAIEGPFLAVPKILDIDT